MVNLIADYLNGTTYMNQAFQATETDSVMGAAMCVVYTLRHKGYTPVCVHEISGSYTLEQLADAEACVSSSDAHLVWCDSVQMQRAAQLTPEERLRAQRWSQCKG